MKYFCLCLILIYNLKIGEVNARLIITVPNSHQDDGVSGDGEDMMITIKMKQTSESQPNQQHWAGQLENSSPEQWKAEVEEAEAVLRDVDIKPTQPESSSSNSDPYYDDSEERRPHKSYQRDRYDRDNDRKRNREEQDQSYRQDDYNRDTYQDGSSSYQSGRNRDRYRDRDHEDQPRYQDDRDRYQDREPPKKRSKYQNNRDRNREADDYVDRPISQQKGWGEQVATQEMQNYQPPGEYYCTLCDRIPSAHASTFNNHEEIELPKYSDHAQVDPNTVTFTHEKKPNPLFGMTSTLVSNVRRIPTNMGSAYRQNFEKLKNVILRKPKPSRDIYDSYPEGSLPSLAFDNSGA